MILKEIFAKVKPFLWLVPGFLLWAAFPPYGEKIDVLFALAPLIYLSRTTNSVKVSVRRWFAAGLFFWIATLAWMPAIVKNGGPWPLVILGLFALSAYCAAYFALYGWLSSLYWRWASGCDGRGLTALPDNDVNIANNQALKQSNNRTIEQSNNHAIVPPRWRMIGIIFVEPILWCGLELIRSRFLGGFAWNQLGVVAVNGGFGAPAAFGGVYLCSAAIFLINGSVAGIIERVVESIRAQRERRRVACSRLRSLETVLAFVAVWGIYRLDRGCPFGATDARLSSPVKVALIQRNFPCVFKGREENPYEVYGKLLENVGMLKPDLVVFSESAACEFGPLDQQGVGRFAAFVAEKTGGAASLVGGTHHREGKTFNSAGLFCAPGRGRPVHGSSEAEPQNDSLQIYDKVHLVPFGEFIPGDKWFPILQNLAPVGSCTPGDPRLLKLGDTPMGVAICFEDTDSALIRRFAAMGAKLLVFITNDSWFSNSIEPVAHFWQATARAVETGLPVVRVGNSGVTATITPEGRITALTDDVGRPLMDRRGTMFDRILVGENKVTVYTLIGDWPLGALFSVILLAMILVYYKAKYEKRRYLSM